MKIAGIDPGNSGAIAFLHRDTGEFCGVIDMPLLQMNGIDKTVVDGEALFRILYTQGVDVVVLEYVHSMPNQGVASTFKFGESFGIVQGVVMSLGLYLFYVRPQRWKKSYDLIGKDKDAARDKAIELYPDAGIHLKRKKDVGRADALLIAGFGYLCSLDIPNQQ